MQLWPFKYNALYMYRHACVAIFIEHACTCTYISPCVHVHMQSMHRNQLINYKSVSWFIIKSWASRSRVKSFNKTMPKDKAGKFYVYMAHKLNIFFF